MPQTEKSGGGGELGKMKKKAKNLEKLWKKIGPKWEKEGNWKGKGKVTKVLLWLTGRVS